MKPMVSLRSWLLAVVMVAAMLSAAHADQAVVVGVNVYPSLNQANLLGCVNDAQAMKEKLERYGFEVTMLTDGQATRQNVVRILQEMRARNRPTERFAFYYAGHGTKGTDGRAVLLPYDAQEGSESHDLTADALYQSVRAIPARSRTVLLDSCFSGGMLRSFERLKGVRRALRTRFHYRPLLASPRNSKDLVEVNRKDDNNHVSGGGLACYFTASRENEQAAEDDFGGARHGVFTYYLTSHLNGQRERWGDVQRIVGGKVAEHMEETQHATLSPAFVDKVIFGDQEAPPKPGPTTVWDDYNEDHADPSKVELRMVPRWTTLPIGEEITFTTKVGLDGYLVILERGVSGNVNLLFPKSRSADDARVEAGATIRIPEDSSRAYAADRPGTERVKAILFTSREKAAALLKAFPPERSITWRRLRDLTEVDAKRTPFYTSDIIFEVVRDVEVKR